MRRAHFRTEARCDGALRSRAVTVTVEWTPTVQLVSVRPLRRRRAYVLPLADVAEIIMQRVARVEAAEARAVRRARGRRS